MKKFLLPLLALALSATAASAQAGPGPGGRPQRTPEEMAARQTEGLTKQLGLSADQSAKVQQIMLARDQEMQAMRGQAGGDRDKMREQMQASRSKYDAQFKEVLTADQYTKYTSMEANRMNRGGRGMGGPGMGGPGMSDGANIDKMKAKTDDGEKIKVKGDKVKAKAGDVKVKSDN